MTDQDERERLKEFLIHSLQNKSESLVRLGAADIKFAALAEVFLRTFDEYIEVRSRELYEDEESDRLFDPEGWKTLKEGDKVRLLNKEEELEMIRYIYKYGNMSGCNFTSAHAFKSTLQSSRINGRKTGVLVEDDGDYVPRVQWDNGVRGCFIEQICLTKCEAQQESGDDER